MPLRFRVMVNGNGRQPERPAEEARAAEPLKSLAVAEGQALNLSERGIYFTSREKLSVGQALEIYFTLPSELTGRSAEQVRCRAHVVHIDHGGNTRGIGASVERFEPIVAARDWSH